MGEQMLKKRGEAITLEEFLILLKKAAPTVAYVKGFLSYSKGRAVFNCEKHGEFEAKPRQVVVSCGSSCKQCFNEKRSERSFVNGVGKNDVTADVQGRREYYYLWYNVVRRGVRLKGNYESVDCCERWFKFSNFLEDLPHIDNFNMRERGWELDKDLLSKKKKMYSKETTCFLPREINNCLAVSGKDSKFRGVCYDNEIYKYFASTMLDGKRRRFGSFKTYEEAHEKYKEVKSLEVKRLAEKYKENLSERTYNALISWDFDNYV